MATRSSVSGLCEQKYREGIDNTLHTSVMQKQNRLGIKDNRPSATVQQRLLGMIQRTKSSGTTSAGVIQARVPNYAALNALQNRLPVDIIKEKLTVLITDLWPESDIALINDWVKVIVKADGSIDQARYDELFLSDDPKVEKSLQYKDPKQAYTGFNSDDLKKFVTVLEAAKVLVNDTKSEKELLKNVFGEKFSEAEQNYDSIILKIEEIRSQKRGVDVTTDYNGDDQQTGAGGYALFGAQKVHFNLNILNNKPNNQMTIIHECAHLIKDEIKDRGYIGSPGFENMSEDDKLCNAAHYEIVPSWMAGLTIYPKGTVFSSETPATSGNEKCEKRKASEYFREAWTAALNSMIILRREVGIILGRKDLLDFSKKMGLSMHRQHWFWRVTLLDVTLMERITHKISKMLDSIKKQPESIDTPTDGDITKEHFITETLEKSEFNGINRTMLDYLRTKPNERF